MHKPLPSRVALILLLCVATGLVVLNVLHIYRMSVTHDEALTFLNYISASYKDIITCNPATANNHIFNSLLSKGFTILFNSDALQVLRLGNMLALLIYMFYGFLLLKRLFENNTWVLGGFILLNLNPFLFDFWALCRGYGLSIAFILAAVYHFFIYISYHKNHHLFISFLFAALSVYSNMATLNAYLALAACVFIHDILERKSITWKNILAQVFVLLFFTVILYTLLIRPITVLREKEEFYFGGETGVVRDTIYSLLKESFHVGSDKPWLIFTSYGIAIISLLTVIYWVARFLGDKEDKAAKNGLFLSTLLLLPVFSMLAQNVLIGSRFLIERTALFLVPLFIFQLLYTISQTKWGRSATGLLVLIFIANFSFNFQLRSSYTWNYDQYIPEVINRALTENPGKQRITIRPFWIFTPALYYYKKTTCPQIDPVIDLTDRNGPGMDSTFDYYFIDEGQVSKISPVYKIDTTFQNGNFVLLRKTMNE